MTTNDEQYVPDEEDVRTDYALGGARDTVGDIDHRAIPELEAEFDRFLARVRRAAAEEVGQYIERHHPDGLTEKTTVLGYIDIAADRLGRGIHANGRDRETP